MNIVQLGGMRLQNFSDLTPLIQDDVLNWRNDESIRKWMVNNQIISKEDHSAFIDGLSRCDDKSYWIASMGDRYIGVIYFTDIDNRTSRAEFGLYSNPDMLSAGIGLELFLTVIKMAFDHLKFDLIYSNSRIDNQNTLQLHDFFGMKEKRRTVREIGGEKVEFSYREMSKSDRNLVPNNLKELKQMIVKNMAVKG